MGISFHRVLPFSDPDSLWQKFRVFLEQPISLAPLRGFRILFGLLGFAGALRFLLKGWIQTLYLEPDFFFTYPGFGWVKPLDAAGMYGVFALMGLSALGVAFGYQYRLSAALYFLSFTYVELLDKTNYLNHYYFVSIVAFLLCWLPAAKKTRFAKDLAPRWIVWVLPAQVTLVYVFAGLAKLESDWLFHALPLRIWLPARQELPFIGPLLALPVTAYIFSWIGLFYDCTLPFWLMNRRTRSYAFTSAVVFHGLTAWLFPIGMFPWIMLAACTLFFSAGWHERWQQAFHNIFYRTGRKTEDSTSAAHGNARLSRLWPVLALCWFAVQIALPLRHWALPGSLFWTESGYRFSWRVMLMEKAGYIQFTVRDPDSGAEEVVTNSEYLTANQEKMMATQPDMILQFVGLLEKTYRAKGISDPEVYAFSRVSLNGRGSRAYVRPEIDLSKIPSRQSRTEWLMPYLPARIEASGVIKPETTDLE